MRYQKTQSVQIHYQQRIKAQNHVHSGLGPMTSDHIVMMYPYRAKSGLWDSMLEALEWVPPNSMALRDRGPAGSSQTGASL